MAQYFLVQSFRLAILELMSVFLFLSFKTGTDVPRLAEEDLELLIPPQRMLGLLACASTPCLCGTGDGRLGSLHAG